MSKHATLGGASMITQESVLVQLIRLVERIPTPPPPPRRPRGRPVFYSERLFMKALVIMIVKRLHKVGELLAVLQEDTPQMREVRQLLSEGGAFLPSVLDLPRFGRHVTVTQRPLLPILPPRTQQGLNVLERSASFGCCRSPRCTRRSLSSPPAG